MPQAISEVLAEFVVQLAYGKIPVEVRGRAKFRMLDFLGVALAGSRIPSSRMKMG